MTEEERREHARMQTAVKAASKVQRIIDSHKKIKAVLILAACVVVAGIIEGKTIREAAAEGIILSGAGIASILVVA